MADTLDLIRARRVAMSEAAICERNKAMEQILRWCDRSGEEPEGMCLHEIEQICRKQLGLQPLSLAAPVCEHGVMEGDYCEPCNKAYKSAMVDPENKESGCG